MYTFGIGVPKDEAHALTVIARMTEQLDQILRECGSKDDSGCAMAKLLSSRSKGPDILASHAPTLYEAKCRGGDADACAALARLYRDGYHGFSRDTEKADELSSLARKYRSARQDAGDD